MKCNTLLVEDKAETRRVRYNNTIKDDPRL